MKNNNVLRMAIQESTIKKNKRGDVDMENATAILQTDVKELAEKI